MDPIKLTKRFVSNIVEAAGIALEHIPMIFSVSERAPGRKVFFPIPMKKDPKHPTDFVYFYAESKLLNAPQDLNSGFTELDIIDESGVYLFKKDGNFISGCTYPLDVFLTTVIDDLSLRNRIIYRINKMRGMVHLDDEFLEVANQEWITTKKNPQSFGIQRLH